MPQMKSKSPCLKHQHYRTILQMINYYQQLQLCQTNRLLKTKRKKFFLPKKVYQSRFITYTQQYIYFSSSPLLLETSKERCKWEIFVDNLMVWREVRATLEDNHGACIALSQIWLDVKEKVCNREIVIVGYGLHDNWSDFYCHLGEKRCSYSSCVFCWRGVVPIDIFSWIYTLECSRWVLVKYVLINHLINLVKSK